LIDGTPTHQHAPPQENPSMGSSSSSGRHGGRPTIEGCGSYRLSVKDLRQALRCPHGADLILRYRVDDEPMDVRLEVRPAQGCLRLRHPSREVPSSPFASSAAPPTELEYAVHLTWTPAGFGGRRWWFVCPLSGRRCAVLHLPRGGRRFASAKGYSSCAFSLICYHADHDSG
jgi:hypothetical protein